MALSLIPIDPGALPGPADLDRAEAGLVRWREASTSDPELSAFCADLAGDDTGRALLVAIFGNSPYLGRCLGQETAFLRELLTAGPDPTFEALIAGLDRDLPIGASLQQIMAGLRLAKRKASLAVGIADIAGLWSLERVTGALTEFAEQSLHIATRHVLATAAAQSGIEPPDPDDPEHGSGYIVLGMGKLGARELNYSSDIDLIVLYDADRIRGPGRDALGPAFVKATKQLLHVMDARTAEGYVFRTDLRLRPDPAATPLAISVEAAEGYYESVGQNWERAAMIKARPVAGDREAGDTFLHVLRPYIWRKHLDFAAIQDVHSIKRQINAHRGGARIAVNGHNVKLGRGGIREIEFFCQTQQLIWGGRVPELRGRGTVDILGVLRSLDRIEAATQTELSAAYRFLRTVEHRLQMVNDEQTHELPRDDAGIARIAAFMGYDSAEAFRDDLLFHLGRVEHHYAHLFEESPDLGGEGALVFTGGESHPDTVRTLEDMGFADGGSISNIVRSWHHGRYRATRSQRAREILTELMPALLKAFANTASPDTAFARFDEFVAGLPAGVQLFSLFHANPPLLDLVAEIMGGAPRIAEWLSRNPALLDSVLTGDFLEPVGGVEGLSGELEAALGQANDYEDILVLTRRWANDLKFRIGVQVLRGAIGGAEAGAAHTAIADSVLGTLLPRVETEFAHAHGHVDGGAFAVVALGKLGSGELSPGSDLDLVFVYDRADLAEASNGPKPIAPGAWFARFSQRLISAITAPTGEGRLYEIDMRLRPAGNAGPIASRLDGFIRYYREEAWTWEHMALTRARVVAATGPDIGRRVTDAICEILTMRRDPDHLLVDVANMRARIARERRAKTRWSIKHWRGGLVDIEFIVQYLLLRHAAAHPDILATNTAEALRGLARAGILDGDAADALLRALDLWWRLQDALHLMVTGKFDEDKAPAPVKAALARAMKAEDFDALVATIDRDAAVVHGIFRDLIEIPADEARKRLPEREADG